MLRSRPRALPWCLALTFACACAPTYEHHDELMLRFKLGNLYEEEQDLSIDPFSLYTAEDEAFDRAVRHAAEFGAAQQFRERGMDEQPPTIIQLQSLEPLPDESYRARFLLRPSVPILVWHTSDAHEEELELARVTSQRLDPIHEWPFARDDPREPSVSVVLPTRPRVVRVVLEAPSDARELMIVKTPYGITSAPFPVERGKDRAAGRFEQARREHTRRLSDELRARGFAGAALRGDRPVETLITRMDAVARRYGELPCASSPQASRRPARPDVDKLVAKSLTKYALTGALEVAVELECKHHSADVDLKLPPRVPAAALAEPTWFIDHERGEWSAEFSLGDTTILQLYAYDDVESYLADDDDEPSSPTPSARASRHALEREVLRALVG